MQLTDTFESEQTDAANLAGMVREFYENLDPGNLVALRTLYAEDICFEDPIHGLQGISALMQYFDKLFANVEHCQFKFHRSVVSDEGMFFSWTMMLRHQSVRHGELIRVEGSSYLKHRNGKIYYHRDYFDLGAMVYENVPLLGPLVKFIRHRMSH
jgi:ketosteroid isomerase-like protein